MKTTTLILMLLLTGFGLGAQTPSAATNTNREEMLRRIQQAQARRQAMMPALPECPRRPQPSRRRARHAGGAAGQSRRQSLCPGRPGDRARPAGRGRAAGSG